ncbi:MAG: pitrilysin family protein [Fermentimonas sp.]|nr:pitrilysin family protein [Fermentimonas sp.]
MKKHFEKIGIMSTVNSYKLDNGLRIIHRQFPSEISYCGIVVNTGTRDEFPSEYGMAHFVEHMLFKGTKHRKAHHIMNRMENVGGDLNAYTTKEETFIYATFLQEHFPRAMELLSDIIFNSEFSDIQINKEREVILDEINSYDDSPADLIFDDFENLMFQGHEIGHYILGEKDTLGKFNTDNIRSFVKRQYHLDNMVLFSFGKTPFAKVVSQAEKNFNIKKEVDKITKTDIKNRATPDNLNPSSSVIRKNTAQSHVVLGWSTMNMYNPQKYVLYLLNSILGGGSMNSRLNSSLREKHGLVYNVESNHTLYTDTGFLSIYYACDPKNRDKCKKLIQKELKRLMEKELTPMQLSVAKRQLMGQMGIAAENNETNALAMAKSFLHFNRYSPMEVLFSKINEVTSTQVKDMANEIFNSPEFELVYL